LRPLSLLPILTGTVRDLRLAWGQLVLADLLARALAVVVLVPAVGLLLDIFLERTATGVVTDEAIAAFLLHPYGLLALGTVGSVSLAILFVDAGMLMLIGHGAGDGRRVTWLEAVLQAWRRAPRVASLARHALVRLLLNAAPFLAAMGCLYLLLARTHDINYYLATRPPEFLAALVAAGLLLAGLTLRVIHLLAGWLYGLPLVLFKGLGGRQALAESRALTAGSRGRLTAWIVGWVAGSSLLATGVSAAITASANVLVPRGGGRIALALAILASLIVLSLLANLAVSVLATILFPLLIVRAYRQAAGDDPGARASSDGPGPAPSRSRIPGKPILAGMAVALMASSGAAWLALDDHDWDEPVQIIAHRGGAAVAPENTLAAFRQGIADGADWLELDVQENADGTVIIQHDKDFMRAARSPLRTWNATDAGLADLDIGSSFDPRFSGERTPTLRQVLELARGRAGVFIELKYYGHDTALERKVVEIVEETGMADRIVIMSLDYAGVRRAAALRPDWTYGLLNAVALGDLTRLEVDFLALSARSASLATIRHAHRRGLKVHAWTINDPVQMWVMMSRGVDGIITDRVALAREIVELREGMTPLGRWIVWLAGESGLLDGMERSSTAEDA
jgi:glycerophosphoryl diester phosphodiesterase